MYLAEYIWIDGSHPVQQLRSKTKVVLGGEPPLWNFDGSSTGQSTGRSSDLVLKPVCSVSDPFRGPEDLLVLCEVLNQDGSPHASDTRARLVEAMAGVEDQEPWAGFEQEYMFFMHRTPLGWPEDRGSPDPQGPYYCGVGAKECHAREIAESHLQSCLESGIGIYGINAEVAPGQWEFQIGPRPGDEDLRLTTICDHLWIARYILHRVAEEHGIDVSLHAKPVMGDWNGSGMHTNFSTKAMRAEGGMSAIEAAFPKLDAAHTDTIESGDYGEELHLRLTGLHETCDIKTFKWGHTDRGCSVRVPNHVVQAGYGYFEDRRPGANADPYRISARLVETVCR